MELVLKIREMFMFLLLMITLVTAPNVASTETAELVGSNPFIMEQALVMGQGITTDGEYYYTSGTVTAFDVTAIAKYTVDGMDLVDKNVNPLPAVCKDRGNNHIGGISYYNGKIYAPVEGGDEVAACIVVFDAETLEATGEVYDLSATDFSTGVPWCAVDKETGYLYASVWQQTKKIHIFDVNDGMKQVGTLDLDTPIKRIQGAEFYNGTLYLSHDSRDKGVIRNILSVDVETGKVSLVAERNVGAEKVEAEGMTFTEGEDGPILHVLDYNRTIGIFVHHYKIDI
ncbi:MAG: hypothetical protein IKV21_03270 [Clostridia bacterium]|nr:hypothetical protein [Clostridia bacterium]